MVSPVSPDSLIVRQLQTPWIIDEKINLDTNTKEQDNYIVQITSRLEKFTPEAMDLLSNSLKDFNDQVRPNVTTRDMLNRARKFLKQHPALDSIRVLPGSQRDIYQATKECIVQFKDGTRKEYKITVHAPNSGILKHYIAQISPMLDQATSRDYYEIELVEAINNVNKQRKWKPLEIEIIPMMIVVTSPEEITSPAEKVDSQRKKLLVIDPDAHAKKHYAKDAYAQAKQSLKTKKEHLKKIKNARANLDNIKKVEREVDSALKNIENELDELKKLYPLLPVNESEREPAEEKWERNYKETLGIKLELLHSKKELIEDKLNHYHYLSDLYNKTPFNTSKELSPSILKKVDMTLEKCASLKRDLEKLEDQIEEAEDLYSQLES